MSLRHICFSIGITTVYVNWISRSNRISYVVPILGLAYLGQLTTLAHSHTPLKGILFPSVINSFSGFSVNDIVVLKIFIRPVLHSSMNFKVNANKPNYILSRMPKIVYTEYDIDDEKEESENHKSV